MPIATVVSSISVQYGSVKKPRMIVDVGCQLSGNYRKEERMMDGRRERVRKFEGEIGRARELRTQNVLL